MSLKNLLRRWSKGESEKARLKKAFSPYVGDAVAELSFDPSALEPREMEIICIVTRIQDFEALSVRTTLPELGSLMNRYYGLIAEAVVYSQGDIGQFCGPAIVAYYGVNRDVESTTIVTAVGMKIRAAAASLESDFGVHVGMGVCRGTVLYGAFGSSNRRAFSAFGPSLICAERAAAEHNGLNVCEQVAAAGSAAAFPADPWISVHPHLTVPDSTGSR